MSTKSLFTPPSIVHPIAGAIVGYLISESPWGAAAGAFVGALVNVAATAIQMENMIAASQGIALSDNSLSLAARGLIGKGAAAPVQAFIDQQTALAAAPQQQPAPSH